MKFGATVLLLILSLIALPAFANLPGFAKDPAISPDGNTVCFVFDDDLWLVPFKGGTATRLTNTTAREWGPKWSPDGTMIAFNSDRDGGGYPYLISPNGGEAKLIIRENYSIRDWFNDSEHLLATKGTFEFRSSFVKLPLTGERGVVLGKIGDAFASLSPDNRQIVFSRYGDAHREAYQGSLNGELWLFDIDTKEYTKLTNTQYTERYPAFSHFTNSLFYCYSDGKHFQLTRVEDMNFDRPFKMSELADFSARDISVARLNDRIVFEHFDEIYKFDPTVLSGPRVKKLDIHIAEDMWTDPIRELAMKDEIDDYNISTDELLVSFNYKYDNFVAPKKGGEAKAITSDHSGWSKIEFIDNLNFLMVKQDAGISRLYQGKVSDEIELKPVKWFGADSLSVTNITKDSRGRLQLSYQDYFSSGKIALADSASTDFRPFPAKEMIISNLAINHSGSHAAYCTMEGKYYMRSLYLYDFATGEHIKLLSDQNSIYNIHWTKDNRALIFTRGRDLYRLDLLPRDEFEAEEDNWKEIFAEKHQAEKPDKEKDKDKKVEEPKVKVDYVLEDIDKRLFSLYEGNSSTVSYIRSLSDSTFLFLDQPWSGGNAAVLKKGDIYGKTPKEEMNFGNGCNTFRLVNTTLYYLNKGALKYYNTAGGAKGGVPLSLDYSYNEKELNARVFEEVWGMFNENFYDPNMHGQNWRELYHKYRPYVDKARSINEVGSIIDEMVGDLNASHTGFYPRSEPEKRRYKPSAYLGVEFDNTVLLDEGIKIERIYPTTRLATHYKIKPNAILTHIDKVKITPKVSVDNLLLDKAGKPIEFTILQDGKSIEGRMLALSGTQQYQLWRQFKNNRNQQKVEAATNGRVGYIHIPGMMENNYTDFYRDYFLYNNDKEAVILDFRGNTGGRVHDQIISLLTKPVYGYSRSRRYGEEMQPEPRFGINVPTVVLVDEHSFSDGEIFPIVYQQLALGTVIGYPSSGAVIGTTQRTLLDGSEMRMPGTGWFKLDGTNMEGTGAMPDIIVELTINDLISNNDKQLSKAIEEILKELQ